MMKNKQGGLTGWVPIVIAIGLGLVMAAIIATQMSAFEKSSTLGATQKLMIEAYAKGEMARNHIRMSAKYASYQAIHELGMNGGFNNCKEEGCVNSDCGTTEGYAIWLHNDRECLPTEVEIIHAFDRAFADDFNQLLFNYLIDYIEDDESFVSIYDSVDLNVSSALSSSIRVEGIPNIYEIDMSDFDIEESEYESSTGISKIIEVPSSLMISNEAEAFEYSIDPYFEVEVPINLREIYTKVVELAKGKFNEVKGCNNDQTCLNDIAKKLDEESDYKWNIKSSAGGTAFFDVESEKDEIVAYTYQGFKLEGVPVRFAIL